LTAVRIVATNLPINQDKIREKNMIYESRVYRCIPGRLPALLRRFETVTLKLFEKHGIRQAGFFTTLIGESNQELTYFLAWESLAERETKWTAFMSDPDWISARAKSEEDGQIINNIVSQLLVPTGFSAVK
jgi:NIPSNAP protein